MVSGAIVWDDDPDTPMSPPASPPASPTASPTSSPPVSGLSALTSLLGEPIGLMATSIGVGLVFLFGTRRAETTLRTDEDEPEEDGRIGAD